MRARRRFGQAFVATLAWALTSQASPESDGRAASPGHSAQPAAQPAQPIRPIRVALSESLAEECSSTTALFEHIAARTDRIQRASTDAEAFVRLVVKREGDRLVGELTVEERAGRTERSVSASTCEAVVAAFAVMVVVALDPDAESRRPSPSASPQEHTVPVAVVVTKARPAPSTPPLESDVGPAIGLSGGVGLALQSYEGAVLERSAMLELSIGTPLYPRVRAALARSAHVAVTTTSDRSDLVWTTGRASLCGGPGWLHRHHISLCATTSIGTLDATVARPGGPERSLLWVTAGPSAVLDVDFGSRLGLEIEAGMSIPALRDRFFFEPATLAYSAPLVSPFIGVTLVSHFFRSRE
ncbi:hypothetical protein AKJ09_01973 [Labilithrix luteola]|uniref:Uncharacterized protein n=1 Tax=Labilithrix luteola TaxID=1391654 RepID=A0A0K1PQB6_9BACT|nr:hypothetical protein [Labilithrix luteola]AKU95309.1 hypothetical protein AKJ09_01973 [Labilithrix luteola]